MISIPGARTSALALGGSRNDLLVTATAAALGAYHDHLGLGVPELRMAMPAGRRRDGHPGGNWFAPTRVVVPTDGGHPGPFFGVVAERLDRARHEPALPLTSTVASAVSLLPSRALRGALHSQARSVDFVATCFPGLRRPQTICGATVEESYPFGPRLGCLMNITAFGNGDRLDVGVTLDPASVTEPEVLLALPRGRVRELRARPGTVDEDPRHPCLRRRPRGRRRMARRPARRGRLGTLIDDATAVLQSVINEVAPGVVDAIDVDEVVERLDVQAIVNRVDVQGVLDQIDVQALVERLDLDALVERIDVQAVVERLDLDALVERIDIGLIIDRVDLSRVLAQLDFEVIVALGERAPHPDRRQCPGGPARHGPDPRQGRPERGAAAS